MLTHHRDGLLSSNFSLILDSLVGLWVGIQSAGEYVSWDVLVRILHSADEDNLSHFDSNITCLCQSIELNNNHTRTRTHTHTNGMTWRISLHSLILVCLQWWGPSQIFSGVENKSVGRMAGIDFFYIRRLTEMWLVMISQASQAIFGRRVVSTSPVSDAMPWNFSCDFQKS